GRYKVYIIDEVHMLSKSAFNAMLKTLEEPPGHVEFILATTDPQKLPITVLSRCLQFNLKNLPPSLIADHLSRILDAEEIAFEKPALELLGHAAEGSVRDSLSLLDQAIAYGAGEVKADQVSAMLGALDQSYLIRLLDALLAQDGKALLDVADEMAARSLSYKAALQDLGSLLHQIAVAQMVPAAVAEDIPEREQVLRLAQSFAKEEVQLFYQIAVHGRNELALAPDEYAGFSMTLLRMLAFKPVSGEQWAQPPASTPPAGGRPALPANNVNNAPPAQSTVRSGPVSSPAASSNSASNANTAPVANIVHAVMPVRAPAEVPKLALQDTPEATASAPAAGTRVSPVLAALAAARANTKNGTPAGKSATAEVAPVAKAAIAPVAPVTPVAPIRPVTPVVPPTVKVAPPSAQPVVKPAQPISAPAPLIAEQDMQSMGMDDMPPPWDEEIFFDAEPAKPAMSPRVMAAAVQQEQAAPVEVAVLADTAAAVNEPQAVAAEVVKPKESITLNADRLIASAPVPELNWDGQWPALAASLPVRGVAQQMTQQSELVSCKQDGNAHVFRLRLPLSTLLSSGSVEKLSAALSERFEKTIRVETEIGAVEHTANAQAVAEREVRQQQAEKSIQGDSFVQTLMREFGATIVTGSIRPV
ncbi:MAG: DNA polymerase III subunit gamma/tau, partial [Burkholderiales bacterium]|nr:DNA polymerase III subunit gamma/tau [Burkholderiales bacterium]